MCDEKPIKLSNEAEVQLIKHSLFAIFFIFH